MMLLMENFLMTFDCSKNSGTSNEIKLELIRHANDVINITNSIFIDGSDSTGAINIRAPQGGMRLQWNDSKDLWVEGGRTIITANENASSLLNFMVTQVLLKQFK